MVILVFIRIMVIFDYENDDIIMNSFLIRLMLGGRVRLVRLVNSY